MENQLESIISLFNQAIKQFSFQLDSFEINNVKIGNDVFILETIAKIPAINMSNLSTILHLPSSTATRSVDHLVKLGLISRSSPPNNRKQILLSLTPMGINFLQIFVQHQTDSLKDLFTRFTAEEIDHFTEILEKIVEYQKSLFS